MGKYLRHFMIFFLLALVGLSYLYPTEVFADRSFNVPEVQEDFGQVDQAPQPQEKTESIQQNTKEENGTWDWITKPVSDGWKWAEEKISAAKEWTKENAPAFWEAIEKFLALLTSIVIVPVYFFKGEIKVIVDLFKDIWDLFNHPIENLKNLLYAVSHPIETGKAIWQSISESWMRDVVNGDAKSRAEWFGYATGQIVLAIVGTKGVDKAVKLAKGSKVAQSARLRLIDRLPAPAQKFFSKDGWRNIADYYLRGQKINWKNTLITGATSFSLLGLGVFGVPKVVKFVKKIDIDCSFAAHQATDSYLAAMLLPDLNCDFSYDKDKPHSPESTNIAQKDVIKYQDKPDANGWYKPVKTPTPEELNKQTRGLYEQAKKDRQQLVEEITALQNDKEFQKKYSPYVIKKLKALKQKAKGKRPVNFLATKIDIGGKEIQLKAFSGEVQEGLLEGWTAGSERVKFKTMFTRQDLNYGFEENVSLEKIAEILKNNGEKRLEGVTDRSKDTEPKVFSEISEILGENNPGKETDRVVAYSEYDVCPSCGGVDRYVYDENGNKKPYIGVIEQFAIKHPNVTIEMYDSKGRKLVRRGIDDFPELVFKKYPELVQQKNPDLYKKLAGGK